MEGGDDLSLSPLYSGAAARWRQVANYYRGMQFDSIRPLVSKPQATLPHSPRLSFAERS